MSYFSGSGDLAGTTAENYNFDSHSKDRVSTFFIIVRTLIRSYIILQTFFNIST